METPARHLILASTSAYRRMLLERLRLPFTTARPEVDETPLADEPPATTANRLALAKAMDVAHANPRAWVIGSDQVACIGARQFGKPGSTERAVAQLRELSGETVIFHTALAVVCLERRAQYLDAVPTEVRFRHLDEMEIRRYVELEQPLDCAGSAKSEGLGISLLEHIRGDDPNALIGLPLIRLAALLRQAGYRLP